MMSLTLGSVDAARARPRAEVASSTVPNVSGRGSYFGTRCSPSRPVYPVSPVPVVTFAIYFLLVRLVLTATFSAMCLDTAILYTDMHDSHAANPVLAHARGVPR